MIGLPDSANSCIILANTGREREEVPTIGELLGRWQSIRVLGRKVGTVRFIAEIVTAIGNNLDLALPAQSLDEPALMQFAQKVSWYSPSRWNCMVSAMRYVTGDPRALKYRKLRFKDFRPPNQQEFALFLGECDRMPRSQCGLIVRLLYLTGMRIAEARALLWEHVDDVALRLPGSITKNGKPRTIPFLPGTSEILDRLRAIKDGPHVLPHFHMRRALATACRKVGIKTLSYHDFRRLWVTRCIEQGVDLPTLSRWAGHSDGGALLGRVYFHLLDAHSMEAASKVRIAI